MDEPCTEECGLPQGCPACNDDLATCQWCGDVFEHSELNENGSCGCQEQADADERERESDYRFMTR